MTREIDLVRLKSGLEMLALVLNSIRGDKEGDQVGAHISKLFGGLDFDNITLYAQMDVWHAIMGGLPASVTTTDAFLLFLEQLIQYIRGTRDEMPDAITDDQDNADMFETREQVIRIDMGDTPTRYRMKGGDGDAG